MSQTLLKNLKWFNYVFRKYILDRHINILLLNFDYLVKRSIIFKQTFNIKYIFLLVIQH